MKATFINLMICLSMGFMAACEKAEVQKSNLATDPKLENRTVDDCMDCAVTDCCCSVTLLSDAPVEIQFCGTSTPFISNIDCSTENVGMCNDISGHIEYIVLDPQFDTDTFCVQQNTPFGIIYANINAQIRITCQVGQATPQTQVITLNTPPNKPYWVVDGDCELTPCF